MCGFKQGIQDLRYNITMWMSGGKRKNTKDIVIIGSSVCEMAINV